MNVKTMKKIRMGREAFPKFNLKKRGRNNFQKFNYFKLEDLIPVDNAICKELNLFTHLNQSDENNISLDVYDLDQDDEQEPVRFFIPACTIVNGNITQGSQEHGNVQTYSWRYLLYQLWNVSESDEIDASDIGLNSDNDEIETNVSEERVAELTHKIGEEMYKAGKDNTSKSALLKEAREWYKKKKITNDEFIEIEKVINNMA